MTLGAGAAVYIAPAVFVGMVLLLWRGSGGSRLAVVTWILVAGANVVLAALAFQIIPSSVLAFATPHHSQAAAVLLLALDFGVLGWLPGASRPGDVKRRLGGLGVLALGCVLVVVAEASATPFITLGALVALVAIAAFPPGPALRFLAGAGAPLLALPLSLALALPAWLTLGAYLPAGNGFTASAPGRETEFGNLTGALRGIQIAGIWLDGDFRSFPNPPTSSFVNHLLIWCVIAGGAFAIAWSCAGAPSAWGSMSRSRWSGLAVLSFRGTVPWLIGKSLAFSSPAVLLAGTGRRRDSLQPRAPGGDARRRRPARRRSPAACCGPTTCSSTTSRSLRGRAWRSCRRSAACSPARARPSSTSTRSTATATSCAPANPVEPAEYRDVNLPTLGNALLTDPAWADLDSFSLATLRALSLAGGADRARPRASPPRSTASARSGRAATTSSGSSRPIPASKVIEHFLLGDNVNDAYCGAASNVANSPSACPIKPAAVPACTQVHRLAATAASDHGELLAYQRTNPLVVRARRPLL